MAFIKVKTTEKGVFTIKKREANAALRDEWTLRFWAVYLFLRLV